MILTIDCGNTSIKVGIFSKRELISSFTLNSSKTKSMDEYAYSFKNLVDNEYKIEGAIISSVVPLLTKTLFDAIKKVFRIEALIVGKSLKTKLPLKIDNPNELGSDLISGAIGAKLIKNNAIAVADLGTASKIYILDKNGFYIGGIIMCGLGVSMKALVSNTSLLLETNLNLPNKVIGKNTKDCIQSGVTYSQVFAIKEFINRMEKELGYPLYRVLTGGYSEFLEEEFKEFDYQKNLILNGLLEIYYLNNNG